ncbi:MAG: type II secretion system F family protein [Bacillota bacterium]
MPVYKYQAVVSTTGESIEGTYTGKSRDEVIQMLRQKRHYPVSIKEMDESREVKLPDLFGKVKTKDLAVFCRQFYSMLNAGISIVSCLDILSRQIENKKLKKVTAQIYEDVQKGLAFSETLRSHKEIFPELLVNMVEAGELSGNLDVIMNRMAVHYEKENKIKNKIRGAMAYPIILSIVAISVVVFLLTVIMPTFIGMFEGSGVELPLPTQILLRVSALLKIYWYMWLAVFIGGIFGVKSILQSSNGRLMFDTIKLRLPIIRQVSIKVMTSRFTRTLSTLLVSGIPLLQAMDIVAKILGNSVAADGILKAKDEIRKGTGLAEPIRKMKLFPPMVDSMIAIGEESGSLDDILDKTANFYDDEVETALTQLTTMLEPLMIVIMAVVIGAIVIAMVLPMFDMINTVQM